MSDNAAKARYDWHSLGVEEILQLLDSDIDGLSTKEAKQRILRHGPNRLKEGRQ